MKRQLTAVLAIAGVAALLLFAQSAMNAQAPSSGERALKAAMDKEIIDGDPKGAIELYKKIAEGKDRALAARALIRMAESYENLGDTQSRKIYEQVVAKYPDQKEAVAAALARLDSNAARTGEFGQKLVWNVRVGAFPGSITRDGRHLAFMDQETGDLALHDFVTGKNRLLTNNMSFVDRSVFSPDGARVACTCWEKNGSRWEFRLIDLSSRTKDVTVPFSDEIGYIDAHDWSPDGKWIAVQIEKPGLRQIALLNPDNGSLKELESVDWRQSTRLFFSPDSKYLAYDLPGDDGRQRDVFVIAIDGSRKVDAVIDPAMDTVMGWSPDGKHLIFASDRRGSNSLWALPFQNGNPQGDPKLLKANIGSPYPMGVSRAGTLYYGMSLSERAIFVASVDFDSGKLLSAPVVATKYNIGDNRQPSWSSDGKYLAYATAGLPRDRFNILSIVSVETGQVRQLRLPLDYFQFPLWFPGDKSLLVRGTDLKGRGGLLRIDRETGDAVNLGGGGLPLWPSANGERVFVRRGENVVERILDSGTERVVLERYGDSMSISPDERFYAYIGVNPPTKPRSLTVASLAGGESRELEIESGTQTPTWTTWTPDGRSILFGHDKDVWMVPVTGGQTRRIDLGWDRAIQFLRVQPGGNKILFQSSGNTSLDLEEGVWVMENFLPK